jgi:hypothetical protein
MSDKSWKAFERRCAARMHGARRPVTGLDRGEGDVYTAMFEMQCKLRAGIPEYLRSWLAGVVASAAKRDRVGVVVWKEPGHGIGPKETLVVMRFSDFVALHGTPEEREP